jgi:hypothetical protein
MDDRMSTKPLLPLTSPPLSQAVPALPRRRMGFRGSWLAIDLPLVLAAAIGAAWWSMPGTETVRYVTVPATRGDIARTVTATGTVNPELTIIVGSYVLGVIHGTSLRLQYRSEVRPGGIDLAQVARRLPKKPTWPALSIGSGRPAMHWRTSLRRAACADIDQCTEV